MHGELIKILFLSTRENWQDNLSLWTSLFPKCLLPSNRHHTDPLREGKKGLLCVVLLRILCHHFDPQGEVWVYGHHIGSGKAWGDTATYRTVGTDKEQGGRKKELWRKQKKKAQRWDETEEETETKSVKGDKFMQAYMSNDVQ